jgi:DNA-binding CsgD family transcriptional regulator
VSVGSRRPPTAEKVWRDLVAGKLIVLDHRDENGRRYLRVRARSQADSNGVNLTERERTIIGYRSYGQRLKRIAIELGVSVPTVARCLSSALGKLELESDLELPVVFGVGSRLHG